jgi:hypothetical protein
MSPTPAAADIGERNGRREGQMADTYHGLSVEEDEALRRLHWFEENGCALSDDQKAIKETIRARDRRTEIRIPRQAVNPARPAPAAVEDAGA